MPAQQVTDTKVLLFSFLKSRPILKMDIRFIKNMKDNLLLPAVLLQKRCQAPDKILLHMIAFVTGYTDRRIHVTLHFIRKHIAAAGCKVSKFHHGKAFFKKNPIIGFR